MKIFQISYFSLLSLIFVFGIFYKLNFFALEVTSAYDDKHFNDFDYNTNTYLIYVQHYGWPLRYWWRPYECRNNGQSVQPVLEENIFRLQSLIGNFLLFLLIHIIFINLYRYFTRISMI